MLGRPVATGRDRVQRPIGDNIEIARQPRILLPSRIYPFAHGAAKPLSKRGALAPGGKPRKDRNRVLLYRESLAVSRW